METPKKETPKNETSKQGSPMTRLRHNVNPITKGITLTPIRKRQTKISLSPVKTPKVVSAIKRQISMDFATPAEIITDEGSQGHTSVIDVPTSALNFKEFSFIGPDKRISNKNLTREQNEALRNYLFQTFNLISIDYSFPFLVLTCEGDAPAEGNRPFTIGGAIVIWLSENDGPFWPVFGEDGGGEIITVDAEIVNKMECFKVPPQQVIDHLALKLFPDCIGLAVLYDTIVIELEMMADEQFSERLDKLPSGILHSPFHLRYWNGPLPNTQRRKRVIKPQANIMAEQIADETDYVKLDGQFYPGTLIQSQPYLHEKSESEGIFASRQVTAGILVEKDDQKRLICSYHNWEPLVNHSPALFGQTTSDAKEMFRVHQGDPGTAIGFVRERVGDTDIALAQLDDGVIFENKFMEVDVSAKTFVHSEDLKMLDEYIIDSFAVGKQKLKGFGARFVKRIGTRGEFYHQQGSPINLANEPQLNNTYVALAQGAFVTTAKAMTREPHIRDSVCGSVLLRCARGDGKTQSPEEVIADGEICGMMHYADLQWKNSLRAEYFLCYADVFDTLIEDGWTIAP